MGVDCDDVQQEGSWKDTRIWSWQVTSSLVILLIHIYHIFLSFSSISELVPSGCWRMEPAWSLLVAASFCVITISFRQKTRSSRSRKFRLTTPVVYIVYTRWWAFSNNIFLIANLGINDEGFDHIKGCESIDTIILKNCSYLTDEALDKLKLCKDSLKYLEFERCRNITEEGLESLKVLTNLKKLSVKDLPYVKDAERIEQSLKASLTQCEIIIEK